MVESSIVQLRIAPAGRTTDGEEGFTLIEVAIASIITMISLAFLASLFTLALAQNRQVRNYSTTVALAQQKLEELNSIERDDERLEFGGELTEEDKEDNYFEVVHVDPVTGVVTTDIPEGVTPIYYVYWRIEPDPQLPSTKIMSVRVVALQPGYGRTREETTLTTARSW